MSAHNDSSPIKAIEEENKNAGLIEHRIWADHEAKVIALAEDELGVMLEAMRKHEQQEKSNRCASILKKLGWTPSL
jgi:uncharacterized protein with PIN domain